MRHNGLVILRAIAIVGIVVCHICLQLGNEPMGRVTGFLFVQIFLFMSAYLFGINGGVIKRLVKDSYGKGGRKSLLHTTHSLLYPSPYCY